MTRLGGEKLRRRDKCEDVCIFSFPFKISHSETIAVSQVEHNQKAKNAFFAQLVG